MATLTNILLRDDGKLVELAAKCIEHILVSVAKSTEDVDEKVETADRSNHTLSAGELKGLFLPFID